MVALLVAHAWSDAIGVQRLVRLLHEECLRPLVIHALNLMGVLVPMNSSMVNHFLPDLLCLQYLLLKLILALHLQEAKVVDVAHAVHHLLKTSFVFVRHLVEI